MLQLRVRVALTTQGRLVGVENYSEPRERQGDLERVDGQRVGDKIFIQTAMATGLAVRVA